MFNDDLRRKLKRTLYDLDKCKKTVRQLIKIDKRPKLSPFHITDTKCMYFILNPCLPIK